MSNQPNKYRPNPLAGPVEEAVVVREFKRDLRQAVVVSKEVGLVTYHYVARPALLLTGFVAVAAVVVPLVVVFSVFREMRGVLQQRPVARRRDMPDLRAYGTGYSTPRRSAARGGNEIHFHGDVTVNGDLNIKQ